MLRNLKASNGPLGPTTRRRKKTGPPSWHLISRAKAARRGNSKISKSTDPTRSSIRLKMRPLKVMGNGIDCLPDSSGLADEACTLRPCGNRAIRHGLLQRCHVGLNHHLYQFMERNCRLPAQGLARLAGIAAQV